MRKLRVKAIKRLQVCVASLECPRADFTLVQHSGQAIPSWLFPLVFVLSLEV